MTSQLSDEMPDIAGLETVIISERATNGARASPPMIDKMLEHGLPAVHESERMSLGVVFLDQNLFSFLEKRLFAEDFYNPFHAMVYRGMLSLFYRKEVIDPIKLSTELTKLGHRPETYGGVGRITTLYDGLPRFNEESIKSHIQDIIEAKIDRELTNLSNVLLSESLNPKKETRTTLEKARYKIEGLTARLDNLKSNERIGFYTLAEIVPDMEQQFIGYMEGKTNGVRTGMAEVDDMLEGGGLQNQGVYLVAGGEKTGKTSLALEWANNIAVVQNKCAAVDTHEMNKVTMAKRIYSFRTGIPFNRFRPGISRQDFERSMRGLDAFGKIPIRIADNLRTIGQIREHLSRLVDACFEKKILGPDGKPIEFGVGVIDYLQLLELDGPMSQKKRVDVVSDLSREVKLLARDLNVPIIIMSSLNRIGLTEGQIPDTFNLRDSGTIAFDAEAVFFVYNPAYVPGQKYVPQKITDIDLILSRQRNGPTGTIELKFLGEFMQFMTKSEFDKRFGTGPEPDLNQESQGQEDELDEMWSRTQ